MEIDRIFSPDQIQVPPDLARILREYTKACIKENPDDVLEFSWSYFKEKVEAQEKEHAKVLAAEIAAQQASEIAVETEN